LVLVRSEFPTLVSAKSDGVCFVRVPRGPGHGIERLHRTVIVPGSEEGLREGLNVSTPFLRWLRGD
jgi:hypothetical protein